MRSLVGLHPSPALDDLDNIIFTHIWHIETVRPRGLGEREEAINFRTKIANLSQCLFVDNDFLKKFLNNFQLSI